jgi:flavin reductase
MTSSDARQDATRRDGQEQDREGAGASAVTAGIFKAVMRKLAGTVCVISTSDGEGLHGLTATAVCSVCAEPPTILVIVNQSSRTHPHIDARKSFTVNLLAEEQRSIAELFASKGSDQFSHVAHRRLADSCPVIDGAAAFLHCRVEQQINVGSHTIFIAQVLDGDADTRPPLVYENGSFRKLADAV